MLTIFYHLVLLFEFLQIMFFIFYKVEVNNEFLPLDADRRFRIDDYFAFMNFQSYILHSGSVKSYVTFYIILSSLFIAYLTIMLALSNRLYKQERSEDLKQGMKYLVKLFSIMMACFLFLF